MTFYVLKNNLNLELRFVQYFGRNRKILLCTAFRKKLSLITSCKLNRIDGATFSPQKQVTIKYHLFKVQNLIIAQNYFVPNISMCRFVLLNVLFEQFLSIKKYCKLTKKYQNQFV